MESFYGIHFTSTGLIKEMAFVFFLGSFEQKWISSEEEWLC